MNYLSLGLLAPLLFLSGNLHAASRVAVNVTGPPMQKSKDRPPVRRSVPARTTDTLPLPTTTTRQRSQPTVTIPQSAQAQPNRPTSVTSCDPGGCWDARGNRYHSGAGNTYLDQAGKLCNRNGAWIQCF